MSDEEIVITYGKMVYAIAMNYVQSRYDSDDVYSETFLRYFRKERRFESEEHRKAYIIRLAINCSKDFLSCKNRHNTVLIDEITTDINDESITDSDEKVNLQIALEKLQPQERNLIYLFYYQQIKSADIAVMMETSDDAIRSKLKRIREKIKNIIEW